eukprot:GABV01003980.1.p1 GENE.GABV01003980.1~~GABV01003980.1.p1  ORF type:complete len:110 (+),score=28.17 GABV01003980.1:178-507(+)
MGFGWQLIMIVVLRLRIRGLDTPDKSALQVKQFETMLWSTCDFPHSFVKQFRKVMENSKKVGVSVGEQFRCALKKDAVGGLMEDAFPEMFQEVDERLEKFEGWLKECGK